MGNLVDYSVPHLRMKKNYPEIPRIESEDLKRIKNIWKVMEKDSVYYGFAMCTVLFKNHPQYMKYYEEQDIPVSFQEAKIKKKFAMICDVVSALFVDYNNKPSQRNYLVGYIAMVHKDMGLTLEDMENFTSDFTETLTIELPNIMTEEYITLQKKYFNILTKILLQLMDVLNKDMIQMLNTNARWKKCCPWKNDTGSQTMYGYPLRYWVDKKRHWEYRRAIWASMDADMFVNSIINIEESKSEQVLALRKTMEITKAHRRELIKVQSGITHFSTDSDSVPEPQMNEIDVNAKRPSPTAGLFWLRLNEMAKMESTETEDNVTSKVSPMQGVQEHANGQTDGITLPPKVNDNHNDNTGTKSPSKLQEGDTNRKENQTARERKRMRNLHHVHW